ncbi:OmpP1/FadL family transporter [Maribacter chungangensis]|uniref:OmpP1/FadL family transporter n=1 Tax=Maribacter chungangensis TaxID=1069117 RepID=A0ABW3B217_9FLAO
MKRYLTFILAFLCVFASAQNINDVLRYGTEEIQGTARFQSMGGAFGALGGDLSALNINPAGAAVFNNTLVTFSGTFFATDNQVNYFGTQTNSNVNETNINQVGGVFVFNNTNQNSDWKKFSLALNYDLARNFENSYLVSGRSNQGIDSYFLNFAQGTPLGAILLDDGELIENGYLDIGANGGFSDQQAFLGYYGGVLDPLDDDPETDQYISNASYANVDQQLQRSSIGYNSKFTANIASQYKDKLYLGASLNFHSIFNERLDRLTETGYDANSEIQRTTFDNLLLTQGNGFSFTLGAIAKLNESVRIGGSYQSPTWYRLDDELSQRINSDLADEDINFIDFNIINLFERYTIQTPSKLTGSLAVIFGKNGLLSFDYGYQDFSNAQLRPQSDPSFQTVNSDITNQLGVVSTYRLGGEYRIAQVSLRAGYRFEQSPYVNTDTIGDLNSISGGIGYNFGGSRLDFSLNRIDQQVNELLLDTGLITPATIDRIRTNATLSYTINF